MQLDKPVFHFKIPLTQPSNIEDNLAISPETTLMFYHLVKEVLNDKAYIIFTPCDLQVVDCEGVKTVVVDEISFKEFCEKEIKIKADK